MRFMLCMNNFQINKIQTQFVNNIDFMLMTLNFQLEKGDQSNNEWRPKREEIKYLTWGNENIDVTYHFGFFCKPTFTLQLFPMKPKSLRDHGPQKY